MRFSCALVPLTGDGLTKGHLDIIRRASVESVKTKVLIAINSSKAGKEVFTQEERVAIARRAVKDEGIADVEVLSSEGLTADFFLREGCDRIFRGYRNDADLNYERLMASANAEILMRSVEDSTVLLEADPKFSGISSSRIKEMVGLHQDVDRFVPLFQQQMLQERMVGQFKIGVTGRIGVGKSFVAAALVKQARTAGLSAMHLNIDELLRSLYEEVGDGAQRVRDTISAKFGAACLYDSGRKVHRANLSRRITAEGEEGSAARMFLEELTKPHIGRLYRTALTGFKGLVVLEWSQIAEQGMSNWVNGNVIVVDSPDRERFITERQIEPERLAVFDQIQYPTEKKCEILERAAVLNHHGKVLLHQNIARPDPDVFKSDIKRLLERVQEALPGIPNNPSLMGV